MSVHDHDPGRTDPGHDPRHNVPPPDSRRKVFSDIDIAGDGSIWAVDNFSAQRHIGELQFVPEGDRVMARIAVASRTDVYGLDSNWHPVKLSFDPAGGKSHWRDMVGDSWGLPAGATQVLPILSDIDAASDGTVCGVLGSGARWNGYSWDSFGTKILTKIAVGSQSFIWAIDYEDNLVQHWDGGAWQPAPPLPTYFGGNGQAISIVAGDDGVVWAVGNDHRLYQLDGGQWLGPAQKWFKLDVVAGPNSYNLIGLSPMERNVDGELTNTVWFSGFGPLKRPPG